MCFGVQLLFEWTSFINPWSLGFSLLSYLDSLSLACLLTLCLSTPAAEEEEALTCPRFELSLRPAATIARNPPSPGGASLVTSKIVAPGKGIKKWMLRTGLCSTWGAYVTRRTRWGAYVTRRTRWGAYVTRCTMWRAYVTRRTRWGALVTRRAGWGSFVTRRTRWGAFVTRRWRPAWHCHETYKAWYIRHETYTVRIIDFVQ